MQEIRENEHWTKHEHGTRHKEIQFLESTVITVSYLVHYDTILPNTTDFIAKCNSNFITKFDEGLLQMQQFCYQMRQLLQNSTFIRKWVGTTFNITNETKSNETKFVSKNKSVTP